MNYKLLFQLEQEAHKKTKIDFDWLKFKENVNETTIYNQSKIIERLKEEIFLLESKKSGEVEPKLQQRIITEIYI